MPFYKLGRQTNENAEEWLDRFRLAAVWYKYKEIDGQLKEQFIHGLNDNDMLEEIIRELTRAKESAAVASEQILILAKRVGA